MIGQLIDARSPTPVAAIVLLLVSALLAVWAVAAGNPHPMIAAELPLAVAIALWIGTPRHALVMVESDGLMHLSSSARVPYEQITAITLGGTRLLGDAATLPALPMEIHYNGNCLVLPAKMNVSPVQLHQFLWSRVQARPERPPHPLLNDYFAEQQSKFGREKVRVIHTRELFPVSWRRRRNRWVCGAILLTGVAWIASAVSVGSFADDADPFGAWIALGSFAFIGAFLGYFALRNDRGADSQVAKFPNACIVIGPVGFAMVQGDIQGAIRWNEITNVKSRISQWLRTTRARGLQVLVRGAEIIVLDIYEKSPTELERLFRSNLNQPTG